MSLMAHPLALRLRNVTRRAGLNRVIARLLAGEGYEARVSRALRTAIKDGDCVWDIGANHGWYTERFAGWAGPRGRVFAFEPDPENAARLAATMAAKGNVAVLAVGLSDRAGQATLRLGNDPLRATSMIVADAVSADPRVIEVALTTGDAVVAEGRALPPDVVKIDAEGHEYDVLQGMAGMLGSPRLRDLFIEVHFDLLARQGRSDVPARIESLLTAHRFTLRWLDPSHLHASR